MLVELYLRVTAGRPDRDGEAHHAREVGTIQINVPVPGLDLEATVIAEVELPGTCFAPRPLELPLVVLTNEKLGIDYPLKALERDRHGIGFRIEAIEYAERDPALHVEVISVRPVSASTIEPHVGLVDRKLILVVDGHLGSA